MGQAILDKNVRKKTFGPAYFVVHQVLLEDRTQNEVSKFESLAEAKKAFDEAEDEPSKILVDGESGKIVDKSGPKQWVAQNLVFMYQHVHGKVLDEAYN